MPCRRRGADMQEMGPYQVVIGKEDAQDLIKRADCCLPNLE